MRFVFFFLFPFLFSNTLFVNQKLPPVFFFMFKLMDGQTQKEQLEVYRDIGKRRQKKKQIKQKGSKQINWKMNPSG